jgi:nitroreductase
MAFETGVRFGNIRTPRWSAPRFERLVDAAILAPSAMNLQPWAFAALVDRKRVSECSERIMSWLLANFSETSLYSSLREHIQTEGFSVFHGAPALVLILVKSSQPQAVEDCCLAAQNLMPAARDDDWESAGSDWRVRGLTGRRPNASSDSPNISRSLWL